MKPVPLSRIAQWTGGRLLGAESGRDVLIDCVATDTRTLDASDGARAVRRAQGRTLRRPRPCRRGRRGRGAGRRWSRMPSTSPCRRWSSPTRERALGRVRRGVQHTRSGKVVAITGSNGKTSVKTLLLSILRAPGTHLCQPRQPQQRDRPAAAPCSTRRKTRSSRSTRWAPASPATSPTSPRSRVRTSALVNNIAPAHLERHGQPAGRRRYQGRDLRRAARRRRRGDQRRRCVRALFRRARAWPAPDPLRTGSQRRRQCARSSSLDASGTRFVLSTPDGDVPRSTLRAARPPQRAAMRSPPRRLRWRAGAALRRRSWTACEAARPVAGRLVTHRLANGALADRRQLQRQSRARSTPAIDTLAARGGEAWLVLGDMRELGADAEALHARDRRASRAGAASRGCSTLGTLSAAAGERLRSGGGA